MERGRKKERVGGRERKMAERGGGRRERGGREEDIKKHEKEREKREGKKRQMPMFPDGNAEGKTMMGTTACMPITHRF